MKHLKDIEQYFWAQTGSGRPVVNRPLVPVYRVGELFLQGRRRWSEGAEFAYSPGGLELTLFHSEMNEEYWLTASAKRSRGMTSPTRGIYSQQVGASCRRRTVRPRHAHFSGSPLSMPRMVLFKRSGE
jgi:hypothetical protein